MAESIQKRLLRERPPRVKITYDVETGGAIEKTELPFVMGVVADLFGDRDNKMGTVEKCVMRDGKETLLPVNWEEYKDRAFVEIDKDNFQEVMAEFAPRLTYAFGDPFQESLKKFGIEKNKGGEIPPIIKDAGAANTAVSTHIVFNQLDDFKPDNIVSSVTPLHTALDLRNLLRDVYTRMDTDEALLTACYSFIMGTPKPNDQAGAKPAGATAEDIKTTIDTVVKNAFTEAINKKIADIGKTDEAAVIQKALTDATAAATSKLAEFPSITELGKAVISKAIKEALDKTNQTVIEDTDIAEIIAEINAEIEKSKTNIDEAVKNATKETIKAEIDKKRGGKTDSALEKAFKNAMKDTKAAASIQYIKDRSTHLKTKIDKENKNLNLSADQANPRKLIKFLIKEVTAIDDLISDEMDRILHDPKFQKLEAAWRGLFYLVRNTATGTGLKLKVLNAKEDELYKDLTGAIDFDQSHLFKMVYEETYGTQGGHPYSCLIHAHEYGKDDRSVELATEMTKVAAAAHAPLLAAPAPDMFNLSGSFEDLPAPRDLAKIFESAEHTKWNSLRGSEDSRYLSMCLPRVLMRAPYAKADTETFEYEELLGEKPESKQGTTEPKRKDRDKSNPKPAKYLWGNAAYAMGVRITTAFYLYGWTAAIRGMEGGGLVEDLPFHTYTRPSGDIVAKIPTEIAVTDRREKELSDLGFIALCYRLGTDKAVFFGGQTTNKPKKYLEDDATANANLSARLPYMLNASRFAHYVKSIMRDKTGSFLDRESVEVFFNNWLSAYVLLSDNASQSLKASYPLREGRVDVTEDESNPGAYKAVMYLRPHFQMEELEVSIRLVAKLPAPTA